VSVMQSEVFEALWAIDIPEEKALKADMLLLKWMLGFVLAFQVGIFIKLFM
jgi:hypothetical protein